MTHYTGTADSIYCSMKGKQCPIQKGTLCQEGFCFRCEIAVDKKRKDDARELVKEIENLKEVK